MTGGPIYPYNDREMEGANEAGMAASDALLLGRVPYEAFAAMTKRRVVGGNLINRDGWGGPAGPASTTEGGRE